MKELVGVIARALVDEPGEVFVTEIAGVHTSILELTVAKTDIGKVIGRQGRTARALRALVSAAGEKLNRRFHLQILD